MFPPGCVSPYLLHMVGNFDSKAAMVCPLPSQLIRISEGA